MERVTDAIADACFQAEPNGETLFRPYPSLHEVYVIGEEAEASRFRRAWRRAVMFRHNGGAYGPLAVVGVVGAIFEPSPVDFYILPKGMLIFWLLLLSRYGVHGLDYLIVRWLTRGLRYFERRICDDYFETRILRNLSSRPIATRRAGFHLAGLFCGLWLIILIIDFLAELKLNDYWRVTLWIFDYYWISFLFVLTILFRIRSAHYSSWLSRKHKIDSEASARG